MKCIYLESEKNIEYFISSDGYNTEIGKTIGTFIFYWVFLLLFLFTCVRRQGLLPVYIYEVEQTKKVNK